MNSKIKLLIVGVVSSVLLLTGCSFDGSSTQPTDKETTTVTEFGTVELKGEEARSKFADIAKSSEAQASKSGVVEKYALPDGTQYLVFDPSYTSGKNLAMYQDWSKGYGLFETNSQFTVFTAGIIAKDKGVDIVYTANKYWVLTSENSQYALKVNDKGLISSGGAYSDKVSLWSVEIAYALTETDKSIVVEANKAIG